MWCVDVLRWACSQVVLHAAMDHSGLDNTWRSLYQKRIMKCSQPSLLLFIHLGCSAASSPSTASAAAAAFCPTPNTTHPTPPPLSGVPQYNASFIHCFFLPPPLNSTPLRYYLLVTSPLFHLPPSDFLLSFVLHSFILSSHFEQNRFSITCWVPGSFYISQPDPNTAEWHHTHTHTPPHTCALTHIHLVHFRLHLRPNGVEERQENVFSIPHKPVNGLTHKHNLTHLTSEMMQKCSSFLTRQDVFKSIILGGNYLEGIARKKRKGL